MVARLVQQKIKTQISSVNPQKVQSEILRQQVCTIIAFNVSAARTPSTPSNTPMQTVLYCTAVC